MAIIRDYQESERAVTTLIGLVKDSVEEIEQLGDGDEYASVRATKLYDLYDLIDDLADTFAAFSAMKTEKVTCNPA